MARHVIFAWGVTMFQIAIAVAAISVLTRRTRFWYVGLAFAVLGVFFLLQGWLFAHWLDGAQHVAAVRVLSIFKQPRPCNGVRWWPSR